MAIYHLQLRNLTRKAGNNMLDLAGYITGDKLYDYQLDRPAKERRSKEEVIFSEIITPNKYDDKEPLISRNQLWNEAEKIEPRNNSRVGREIIAALPHELSHEENIEIVRNFCKEIANKYNLIADATIHTPQKENDPRNIHAHILITTREVKEIDENGNVKLGNKVRSIDDKKRGPEEIKEIRKMWAIECNKKLDKSMHISEKSYKEQNIDKVPRYRIPQKLYKKMQREGKKQGIFEFREYMIESTEQLYREKAIAVSLKEKLSDNTQEQPHKEKTIAESLKEKLSDKNIHNQQEPKNISQERNRYLDR